MVGKRPAILLLLCMAASGCEFLKYGMRNVCHHTAECLDEHVLMNRNKRLAREAWSRVAVSGAFSTYYEEGFLHGFVDYMEAGGNGQPPVVPPWQYRRPWFQTPEGYAAIQDWYAGFSSGAATAQASGLRGPGFGNVAVGMPASIHFAEVPTIPAPMPLEKPKPVVPEPLKIEPRPIGVRPTEPLPRPVRPISVEPFDLDEPRFPPAPADKPAMKPTPPLVRPLMPPSLPERPAPSPNRVEPTPKPPPMPEIMLPPPAKPVQPPQERGTPADIRFVPEPPAAKPITPGLPASIKFLE
jgi:hypothetical protein